MPEVGSELPTTFGKYYLTEKLATGGMAELYLAKLIGPGGFEKALVIKQIHPRLSGQRHFVDLFVAEAKTLVTLAHGNIVPVYELGVIDDTYFIAMDYIDGPTLYRLTESMAKRDERMDPPVAAWIAARILDGLDYAHRKGEGVIHRDLSPRNVMLSRDGEVKLVDFGIAVTLGEPGEGEASQSAPTGSFPYMSPEQVRRESLTPQTDLFTVGVLFWEMLVGERLFARPDADATLAAVLREEIPRPSARRPNVSTKLDELVMRALERDQAARWPSAGEFLAALNKYLYSLDETPGPRDVAALVARFCPPETRRLPTHLEGEVDPDAVAKPGPSTAVVPRDGQARGKRPKRHQTFATHVDLQDMLERAEVPETADAEPPTTRVVPRDEPDEPALPAPTTRRPRRATTERPDVVAPARRETPSRMLIVMLGIGAIGLAIASVAMFFAKRDDVLHVSEDAPVTRDAVMLAVAPPDGSLEPDASPPDAVAPPDAARVTHADAGTLATSPVDARPDAAPASTGTATLRLGASPWGEVYVDGKHVGRAPHDFVVSAGHHEVKIVFPAESPPLEKTFSIDVSAGETQSFMADFH
jgi:eukaryotic-like serine/threonine-protein kinase